MSDIKIKTPDLFDIDYGVIFSSDRKYRYALWKVADDCKPTVMFVGLNPSTANEFHNDNTIQKVSKIAAFNGFGGFYMLNLFAFISRNPEDLLTCSDAIANNDLYLTMYKTIVDKVVFCWGAFDQAKQRAEEVIKLFPEAYCLSMNDDGSPKHPLYCLDHQEVIPFQRFTQAQVDLYKKLNSLTGKNG